MSLVNFLQCLPLIGNARTRKYPPKCRVLLHVIVEHTELGFRIVMEEKIHEEHHHRSYKNYFVFYSIVLETQIFIS
jgi:hypothetical protein